MDKDELYDRIDSEDISDEEKREIYASELQELKEELFEND